MPSSRRDFLQYSAAVAAAASLRKAGELADPTAPLSAGENPASVRAFELRMLRARPVPIENVRLTGGPLKRAQDTTATYLLSLNPDRMMAYYRIRAGLKPKAEPYGGWDGDGRNLTGHITGHHLSAVSIMYLATGDARFKERANYLVNELKEVQDKIGDGSVSALAGLHEAFARVSKGDIKSGGFDLNGLWSPWYTLHKTFAGLRDAYRYTGNKSALAVETRYAAWAEGVLTPLSDAQVQKMLLTEHGGMNEVLADLYADTGDKRWLTLSRRFEHHAFTDPLKRGQDNLSGKHGNCQIPKLIGSAARYGYTGDTDDLLAASFFWDRVAHHHSYATGGHGLAEYFGAPDELSARVDGRTCETCNCYNMTKLTRRLFSIRPDAMYADYHERVLFNHVLASVDTEDYHTSYMVPVGRAVEQEYQNMQESFTCCVGTGMENHGLHGYGIYYESGDAVNPTLWVNLFAPSTAKFPESGVSIQQDCEFPDGDRASLTVTNPKDKAFTLAIRRPWWAGDGFAIQVNGQQIPQPPFDSLRDPAAGGRSGAPGNEAAEVSSSFIPITRAWKTGDVVELSLPKTVRLEPTPDNHTVAAIMWGPLVLAGDLGPRQEGRRGVPNVTAPVLVTEDRAPTEWVVPAGEPGDYRAQQVAKFPAQPASQATDVSLAPFYRTHRRTYSVYFDVLTSAEFDSKAAAIAAERARVARLEAATIAQVHIGQMTSEREFNYRSEPAERPVQGGGNRASRGGPGWFSFDLPVVADTPVSIVVTYMNEIGLPPTMGNFAISVDGTDVGAFVPNANATGFYDAIYAVPDALLRGKTKVTVKFHASSPTARIAPVFGVRTVRTNQL